MSKWFRKWARNPLGSACRSWGPPALENENVIQSPHRLVVRTSRCGRDNPGSTPGVDNALNIEPVCAKMCKEIEAHPVYTLSRKTLNHVFWLVISPRFQAPLVEREVTQD